MKVSDHVSRPYKTNGVFIVCIALWKVDRTKAIS